MSRDLPAGGKGAVLLACVACPLVVLPLALALPDTLAVAALVVVIQPLVEVVGMVVYVRAVPRLLPAA